jgi:hypothetical protein
VCNQILTVFCNNNDDDIYTEEDRRRSIDILCFFLYVQLYELIRPSVTEQTYAVLYHPFCIIYNYTLVPSTLVVLRILNITFGLVHVK